MYLSNRNRTLHYTACDTFKQSSKLVVSHKYYKDTGDTWKLLMILTNGIENDYITSII